MNILIDSHILYWVLTSPELLSDREKAAVENPKNGIFFSPLSVAELVFKAGKGKITLPEGFTKAAVAEGFSVLNLTLDHCEELRALPPLHSDPFDRLIAAQAAHEGLTLMTRDRLLRRYPLTIF